MGSATGSRQPPKKVWDPDPGSDNRSKTFGIRIRHLFAQPGSGGIRNYPDFFFKIKKISTFGEYTTNEKILLNWSDGENKTKNLPK